MYQYFAKDTDEAIQLLFGPALDAFNTLEFVTDRRCADIAQGLHRRLRSRRDYGRLLSSLQRTPAVPHRASDILATRPSDDYLIHLRAVAIAPLQHRQETARQLIEWADTIEIRNRSLLDAASLLIGLKIADQNWIFTEFVSFTTPETVPEGVDSDLWAELFMNIEEARADTPSDFDALL